jgi:hypothetical protein
MPLRNNQQHVNNCNVINQIEQMNENNTNKNNNNAKKTLFYVRIGTRNAYSELTTKYCNKNYENEYIVFKSVNELHPLLDKIIINFSNPLFKNEDKKTEKSFKITDCRIDVCRIQRVIVH